MAGSVNKTIIIGNLGMDPETRDLPSGQKVANLRVATSEQWTDRASGEKRERTEWHTVSVFDQSATRYAESYLRKGDKVYVEGRVETRKWQDQSGTDRYSTKIVVNPIGGQLIGLTTTGENSFSEGRNRSADPISSPAASPAPTSPTFNGAKHVGQKIPLLTPPNNGNNKENRLTWRAIQKIGSGHEMYEESGETQLTKQHHHKEQFDDVSSDQSPAGENSADGLVKFQPSLDQEMVSTSALGKIVGVKAKPFLFEEFLKRGYIEKPGNQYLLTSVGRSVRIGGRYKQLPDDNEFITWPITLGASLHVLKKSFLDRVNFRLFHMTHVDNIMSILKHGLFSHNTAPGYLDISNPDVNNRRERTDPVHKKSLHEYVPLYFNPTNAMLYEKEEEYQSDIVLLEVSQRVCFSNYTLFTEKNAAVKSPRFAYCLSDVEKFDWPTIQKRNWVTDGVANIDIKQLMMSECLVYSHIDTNDLVAVHTKNTSMSSKLESMLASVNHPSICSSANLFF